MVFAPAWRLDREMRKRLILHETGFTRSIYSNNGYAIKPKKPVRRQADTETQWNTSQVSLFYSFR